MTLGVAYAVLNLFGPRDFRTFNKILFSGFTPFIVFIFMFIGIYIGKKGGELYNIEHGRAANYRPPLTKAQKAMPWIMAVFLGIVAITCMAVTLTGK